MYVSADQMSTVIFNVLSGFCSVFVFLADRTNGRAIGTVLRLPGLYGMYGGQTVRPRAKVTTDSL